MNKIKNVLLSIVCVLSFSARAKDKVIYVCQVSWFRNQGFYSDYKTHEGYKNKLAFVWRNEEGNGNKVYLQIGNRNLWESRWLNIKRIDEQGLSAFKKGLTGGYESNLHVDLVTRSGAFVESVENWTRFIGERNNSIVKVLLHSCQTAEEFSSNY